MIADPSLRAVLDSFDAAFGSLSVPIAESVGGSRDEIENQEMVEFFGGRHWNEISISEVPQEGSFLFHLQPEAFRFYLPVFMKAVLLEAPHLDTLPEDVLWVLTYNDDARLSYNRAVHLFTPDQKLAVRRFLECVRDSVGDTPLGFAAQMALEKYWGREE